MNEISLLIIELIICIAIIPIVYKFYHLEGIYMYSLSCAILTCLMSLKTITIYDYDLNLGIIPLIMIFISSNIIIQKKGLEEIKKHLLTTISMTILTYIILILVSKMESSSIRLFTNASYDNIFSNSERILFANIVTILYSIILNNKLYY